MIKLIFFSIKDTKILFFLLEYYNIKTNNIRYYLVPNNTASK